MNQALDIGTTLKLGWDTFVQAPVALILGFLVLLVLGGVSLGVCAGPLAVGYSRMCLKAARGQPVEVGDIFDGFQQFVPSLILFVVTVVAVTVGSILFLLPGLAAAFLTFFAFWFMAEDPEIGAIDSIRASVAFIRRDFAATLVFALVTSIVASVGNVVGFGMLLTGPLAAAMIAHGFVRARALTNPVQVAA